MSVNTAALDALFDEASDLGAALRIEHPAAGRWLIEWAHPVEHRVATGETLDEAARMMCGLVGARVEAIQIVGAA